MRPSSPDAGNGRTATVCDPDGALMGGADFQLREILARGERLRDTRHALRQLRFAGLLAAECAVELLRAGAIAALLCTGILSLAELAASVAASQAPTFLDLAGLPGGAMRAVLLGAAGALCAVVLHLTGHGRGRRVEALERLRLEVAGFTDASGVRTLQQRLHSGRPFALYLSTSGVRGVRGDDATADEGMLCACAVARRRLGGRVPVFALAVDGARTAAPHPGVHVLFIPAGDWRFAVDTLLRRAAFTVLHMQGRSPGLALEVRTIQRLRAEARSVALVDDPEGMSEVPAGMTTTVGAVPRPLPAFPDTAALEVTGAYAG